MRTKGIFCRFDNFTFHVGFLRASVVSSQRTLGKRQYNWQQLKHIKTKRTTKLPTGKLKSHYAASDEDDERKDMESPHDDVTSARVILAIVAE